VIAVDEGASEEIDVASSVSGRFAANWDPQKARMGMAQWALGVTALLFVAASSAYVALPGVAAAKDVFETAKVVLPPIATLILGFYFKSGGD
jgi:hypothetical protein